MSCNCEGIDRTLYELFDGECTAERRELLIAEIEKCPGCFEKFGIETEVRQLVRQCCCSEAPSELKESISIKIRSFQATYRESQA